eukprot:g22147.t1
MDKETYTHWLDASWEDFRRQLLQAYPENPAAMGTPKDAKMMIEMVSDVPEVGGKQSEQGEMQTCLKSGLEGLSYQEAHAIRNRLRLRLNAIRADALVTGSGLHTAVASLGVPDWAALLSNLSSELCVFLSFTDIST